MAPKNSASTRNHWAATADTKTDSPLLANGIDDEFEIWNGTALTKAVWFFQHLRLLPERRKAFVQLCRTGTAYTVKGSKIAVYHPEHAREYLEWRGSKTSRYTWNLPTATLFESLWRQLAHVEF